MNFALSAILIVVFLLPGAAVLKTYYTSFAEKQSSIHIAFNELLFRGLLISFIIHTIGIVVLLWINLTPQLTLIYHIINAQPLGIDNKALSSDFVYFSVYNLALIFVGVVFTLIFKAFSSHLKWDIKYYSLTNVNYWFFIFSGRYFELENIKGGEIDIDLIYIDVLCTNEVMYSGILSDFNYSPYKDELENVILENVKKRNYIKDPPMMNTPNNQPANSYKRTIIDIPGDKFLIPASTIVNFNMRYLNLSLNDESGNDIAPPKEDVRETPLTSTPKIDKS